MLRTKIRQATLACGLLFALSGCAGIMPRLAPSCDGYARRPLNRSLWNWEEQKAAPAPAPEPEAKPLMRKAETETPVTFPKVYAEPKKELSFDQWKLRAPATVTAPAPIPAATAEIVVPAALKTMPGALPPLPSGQMRQSSGPSHINIAASYQACTVRS